MPRFPFVDVCRQFFKMLHFFILILNISKGRSNNADVVAQNHLKIVQAGDSVNFACIFQRDTRPTMVWVKQKVGENPLPIVKSYQGLPAKFENDFDTHNRFFAAKNDSSFNLRITNTEESDTAAYYCVKYLYDFKFEKVTDLVVKGKINSHRICYMLYIYAKYPVHPEDSAVALQCTVLTQSCAGEHNVYWFRRESGESPPGIIFTQERRNAQCERRSDVNSTAHKCIYSLPKRNLSLSDAGIYYCAVAACGEILFGDARKPDLPRLVAQAPAERHTTLQQSLIDMLHPGDSVSLQCSIFTESCAEEHSVYLFRQSSRDSQGEIYTKGEINGQCENSTESQTQSCVYSLFKRNVSQSDAGIYYCAVAACGDILFGKGTELIP
ncbi:uncharacterized protein LOC132128631 [Carassius carassius]|uniref:uncharacterized protein LOC132128631 n=1 Tax=Carassius carassius TaxID=217509 RepID=UPI0028695163|nr:uncharacterized protein LOC132128631 [Carassius carassius]